MGTFNGAAFLQDQLNSIAAQGFSHWRLLISDDGSSDNTRDIVTEFTMQNPDLDITVIDGPERGFCHNFLSALRHDLCRDCMVAFCDQDDVWLPDKLERAMQHLGGGKPRAYGSVVQMVDVDLKPLSQSPAPERIVDFANLLVENCIVGNSLVLNAAAVDAVRSAPLDADVAYHDWWALLMTTGLGGSIHVDPVPTVLYRQHGGNIVGSASGVAQKRRNLSAITGPYQQRLLQNLDALIRIEYMLTPENKTALRLLKDATASGWKIRSILKMLNGGLRRQRHVDTLVMCLALLKV
jgi:glycosyltransferase involved in cell wall biosynthesis